jgi:hypothetical protein
LPLTWAVMAWKPAGTDSPEVRNLEDFQVLHPHEYSFFSLQLQSVNVNGITHVMYLRVPASLWWREILFGPGLKCLENCCKACTQLSCSIICPTEISFKNHRSWPRQVVTLCSSYQPGDGGLLIRLGLWLHDYSILSEYYSSSSLQYFCSWWILIV